LADFHDLMSMSAWDAPTAVLDFETTGLSPASGDRVCEFAVVRGVPNGNGKKRNLQRLVNPQMAMPELAFSIHHISDSDLQDAPAFEAHYPDLKASLEGCVLVAHNAKFDLGFLHAECHRLGLPLPELGPVICTLDLARHWFGFSHCSLEALARRLGVKQEQAHRAMADARTTFRVYQELLLALEPDQRPTIGDILLRLQDLQGDGRIRTTMRETLRKAAEHQHPVVIDYTSRNGTGPVTRRRTITVRAFADPYITAWCHLRGEDRVFNIRRVQRVIEDP
jgi:DNA polymerase III epsilon subunit family exonuclease